LKRSNFALVELGTGNFATVGGQSAQVIHQIRQVKATGLDRNQQKLSVQSIHLAAKDKAGRRFEGKMGGVKLGHVGWFFGDWLPADRTDR
jgi:hypothetical protein